MRVLVVGAGGVGSAFVTIASRRKVLEHITVADISQARADFAASTAAGNERGDRITATTVDASSSEQVAELVRASKADVVLNACDPRFNPGIFDGAFAAGAHYIDMAMHMSEPHPERPFSEIGVMLGDAQFAVADQWEERGQLALVAMGVEPGFSDVVARFASDHLFSRIDEIGVRDGADLVIDGYDFAPTFSIWTTIEECLNPPIIYERERGWFTTEPFSEPEVFTFPEGIGPLGCVNVEHEEVVLMPRWLDVGRVTFKYGLGDEFIEVLRTLHKLGLDGTKPVAVPAPDSADRVSRVSPRDVVAAVLPNPAELGKDMKGRTCAGTLVTGAGLDGKPRSTYLYHVVDNAWSMREFGHQAVVWQTAVMPAVAVELLATGSWSGAGVLGPEALPSEPFLELLDEQGVEWEWEDYPYAPGRYPEPVER
ncbi:saccharopine dehydrogenase family protein [Desertimonas flava]|uniref:saccharopine dehydrogenase family protein n=1 Tax=Desertimonas flava TaxID=2064846 RepID=UPI000E3482C4|nr:saccharopine dehydrogenase C-terminal domain-containing protein [Desertimonas flava]